MWIGVLFVRGWQCGLAGPRGPGAEEQPRIAIERRRNLFPTLFEKGVDVEASVNAQPRNASRNEYVSVLESDSCLHVVFNLRFTDKIADYE